MTEEEIAKSKLALAHKITQLLSAPKILEDLGKNFGTFARPHAAKDMAQMITTVIRRQGRRK